MKLTKKQQEYKRSFTINLLNKCFYKHPDWHLISGISEEDWKLEKLHSKGGFRGNAGAGNYESVVQYDYNSNYPTIFMTNDMPYFFPLKEKPPGVSYHWQELLFIGLAGIDSLGVAIVKKIAGLSSYWFIDEELEIVKRHVVYSQVFKFREYWKVKKPMFRGGYYEKLWKLKLEKKNEEFRFIKELRKIKLNHAIGNMTRIAYYKDKNGIDKYMAALAISPAIYGVITALARCQLWKQIETMTALGYEWLYSHTDSAFYKIPANVILEECLDIKGTKKEIYNIYILNENNSQMGFFNGKLTRNIK